ncbi:MAG: hypothetical protein AAGA47_08480 [Pseudomonadota bacterium]
MSELRPLFEVMLIVSLLSVMPAALITWVWGGKAVTYVCAACGLATVAFLSWLALTGSFSTGMEGLAFVIWPLLYVTSCIGAFLGFAVVRIVKPN